MFLVKVTAPSDSMARLLTNHDPQHLHALMGALALAHFAWRWLLLLIRGCAWLDREPLWWRIAGVALHVALPLASLRLPLPAKRNYAKPMIWPEARLHSLLFASRHAIACAAALAGLSHPLLLVALNHATIAAAELVTSRYGDRERRTTNAMPYPAHVPEGEVAATKMSYASAQFLATGLAHVTDEPTLCFLPLLPIQIAALLMTLVRKGLATASTYHAVYAWSLWLNLLALALLLARDPSRAVPTMIALICWRLGTWARWRRRWSKHAAWLVAPLGAYAVAHVSHALSPMLATRLPPCPRRWYMCAHLCAAMLHFVQRSPSVCLGAQPLAPTPGNGEARSRRTAAQLVGALVQHVRAACEVVSAVGMLALVGVPLVSAMRTGAASAAGAAQGVDGPVTQFGASFIRQPAG